MANRQRGEVEIELAGKQYLLRPTFEALCELEDRSSTSILEIVSSMEGGKIRLKELTLVIWAGLFGADPTTKLELKDVGDLVLRTGLTDVVQQEDKDGRNPLVDFLVNGVLGGEKVEAQKDSPKPQKRKKKKPS